MLQRFMTLTMLPTLSPDPRQEAEIELAIPVRIYEEVQDLIRDLRCRSTYGYTLQRTWNRLATLLYPCILKERDRSLFITHIRLMLLSH